jgi:hypothetical protein
MLDEFIAVILIALFKMITLLGLTAAIVYLIKEDKNGWGWLVFIAILVTSTSYKYVKD